MKEWLEKNSTKLTIAVIIIGILGIWFVSTSESGQSAERYKGYAKTHEKIHGPATAAEKNQATKDLKEHYDTYNALLRARKKTSDGMYYLDATIKLSEAIDEYNSISRLRYYYFQDGKLPKGYPNSLKDPRDK